MDNHNFVIAILWDTWYPRIANRIIIDLLTLQRWCNIRRITLVVAAPVELAGPVNALGIEYSQDFSQASCCRIYQSEGRDIPEAILNSVPEGLDYDVVYLDPKDTLPPTIETNEKDPYGRFPLPYPGKPIPPTIQPRYYRQKRITEPYLAPFF